MFLQDCVSSDYSKVDIWCGDTSFEKSGLPETADSESVHNVLNFLKNQRIVIFITYLCDII